ncbi:MAG: PAS domain S-box protein [Promethearchaeota archaeon]
MVRMNGKLIETTDKYQFLINNVLDVIIEVDLDGFFSYISPSVYHMLGYQPEEIVGTQFFSYIHQDDLELVNINLAKVIHGEGIISLEYRVKHKNGHYIPVTAKGSLVKLDRKLKLIAVLRDNSQKDKVQIELEKEREKIQLYLDTVGVVVVALNKEGEITMINRKGCEVLEYTEEELIGKNWFLHCLPISIQHEVYKVFQKLMANEIETTEFYENSVVTKNSKEKVIAWHNTVLKDDKGNIIGTLSSGEDITERKKAEKLLKQSEEKYRMIFTGASDPIAILDDDIIVDCNQMAVNLFGFDKKEEIIGKQPWRLSPPRQPDGTESIKKANKYIKQALLGESQRFYWQHLKKDNKPFDAEISLSSFKLENRDHIMAIIRDITERKKAEKDIKEISRLKSELLERTSHELKTPLISIKGFTDLLLDLHREKFDEEVFSILGEIRQGTEQLESIVNKLLESSLLKSGKIQFNPSNEDLSFLIRFCVKNLQGLAKTRNHTIKLDIPDKLILKFEKERIYDVISHLIINAIKYTPPFGEIKLKAEIENDFVIIAVQDNGIGFSMDDKEKIFKQFGKVERYGKGWDIGIEGTGMGLYTSKKIVKLHGGDIWAESEGRNKGSKFSFSLPISRN